LDLVGCDGGGDGGGVGCVSHGSSTLRGSEDLRVIVFSDCAGGDCGWLRSACLSWRSSGGVGGISPDSSGSGASQTVTMKLDCFGRFRGVSWLCCAVLGNGVAGDAGGVVSFHKALSESRL
jgi:hypothetical protein